MAILAHLTLQAASSVLVNVELAGTMQQGSLSKAVQPEACDL